MKILLNAQHIDFIVKRLCHQIIETHNTFENTVIIGIQPRGVYFAHRILKYLTQLNPEIKYNFGILDITFYRDDLHNSTEIKLPSQTNIPFSIENKNIILIDDVLYTGRTIRAALDAILDLGRPRKIELMVLIDRRLSRELPIQPDFVGKTIDSIISQKVKVKWAETAQNDEVILTENS